jgi:hypothetical protein
MPSTMDVEMQVIEQSEHNDSDDDNLVSDTIYKALSSSVSPLKRNITSIQSISRHSYFNYYCLQTKLGMDNRFEIFCKQCGCQSETFRFVLS